MKHYFFVVLPNGDITESMVLGFVPDLAQIQVAHPGAILVEVDADKYMAIHREQEFYSRLSGQIQPKSKTERDGILEGRRRLEAFRRNSGLPDLPI